MHLNATHRHMPGRNANHAGGNRQGFTGNTEPRLKAALLAQGRYGLCDVYGKVQPGRPCSYFTLLRHPVRGPDSAHQLPPNCILTPWRL